MAVACGAREFGASSSPVAHNKHCLGCVLCRRGGSRKANPCRRFRGGFRGDESRSRRRPRRSGRSSGAGVNWNSSSASSSGGCGWRATAHSMRHLPHLRLRHIRPTRATTATAHAPCDKRRCFLSFPYVSPEPVLANDRFSPAGERNIKIGVLFAPPPPPRSPQELRVHPVEYLHAPHTA